MMISVPPPPRGIDAWAALAAGSWLVSAGLARRSMFRLPALAIGGWLLARGVSGIYDEQMAQGNRTPSRFPSQPTAPAFDPVDEASWESFPASDPPAVSDLARGGV